MQFSVPVPSHYAATRRAQTHARSPLASVRSVLSSEEVLLCDPTGNRTPIAGLRSRCLPILIYQNRDPDLKVGVLRARHTAEFLECEISPSMAGFYTPGKFLAKFPIKKFDS